MRILILIAILVMAFVGVAYPLVAWCSRGKPLLDPKGER